MSYNNQPPRHLQIGRWGEELAESHLRRKGWKLLERNWRGRGGEIDRIFRHRKSIVFVEVRTRRFARWPPPYFTIRPRKKQVLRRAGRAYLRTLEWRPTVVRFDVVAVQYHSRTDYELHHAENVGWFGPWFQW